MAGAFYSAGNYWVRVVGQGFGASKNKGTPEFTLRVLILGRVNPEDPEGDLITCEKFERTIYNYITEGTAERLCEDLARLGFDKDSFKYLNPENPNCHSFKDAEFEAYCKHEVYQGTEKEKWSISSGGPAPVKPLEEKEVRQLDTLFGKHLKKATKPKRATKEKPVNEPAPQMETAGAPPEAEEDIPF